MAEDRAISCTLRVPHIDTESDQPSVGHVYLQQVLARARAKRASTSLNCTSDQTASCGLYHDVAHLHEASNPQNKLRENAETSPHPRGFRVFA